ncbi:hypothetical protein ABDK96_01875 [Citricoccus nitrophenolicus]|uniref:HTH cro/C1-type domain-containing protein n=1 Tax=Citricoccus nitrophenolicus TaxID=863575 RepID=A0ABV0IEB5_9MICC
MSEQDNYRRLGELAKQHLKLNGTSRRQFVMKNELNDGTVASFFNGQRIPTDTNLKAITEGLGWDWSRVRAAVVAADSEDIDLADLQPDPWAGSEGTAETASELSDEALLVELTRRLAEKNATIRELQSQLPKARPTAPAGHADLPADLYGLAASDPGTLGELEQQRRAQDDAGEHPQG